MMKRVEITNTFASIFHMQVCVEEDCTDEEILAVCNRENPPGTLNGWDRWTLVERDESLVTGPVRCESYPNRLHLLVVC